MASKLEVLYQTALDAVPATGTILYRDLVAKMQAAGQADAIPMIAELKKRGKVRSKVEFVDGNIVHTYERTGN